MNEEGLLQRMTFNPKIFGGKPIVRSRRLAVEHVLAMPAAGGTVKTVLERYPWLEREDVQAYLAFARHVVGRERVIREDPSTGSWTNQKLSSKVDSG